MPYHEFRTTRIIDVREQYDQLCQRQRRDQLLVTDDVFLDSVDCSEDRIRREINHMKSNASAGPDGIPPILLKKIAPSLISNTIITVI